MIAALYMVLLIFPPVVAICGALLVCRLKRGRWAIPIFVVSAIFLAPALFLYAEALIDPTSVKYPGGGEGFAFLLYVVIATLALLGHLSFLIVGAVRSFRAANAKAWIAAIALGGSLFLFGLAAFIERLQVEGKYGAFVTHSANWIAPKASPFDAFVLGFPDTIPAYSSAIGLLVLAAGLAKWLVGRDAIAVADQRIPERVVPHE